MTSYFKDHYHVYYDQKFSFKKFALNLLSNNTFINIASFETHALKCFGGVIK